MRRSHTSGIRLSRPGATQGPRTPQWPISELGNPKHSDNEALFSDAVPGIPPNVSVPGDLGFRGSLCVGAQVQSSGAGKGHGHLPAVALWGGGQQWAWAA